VSEPKPDLKVVPLYDSNAANIPAMLRKLAQQIEEGDYSPEMIQCVMLQRHDDLLSVECFGWGLDAGDRFRAAGVLTAGISALVE
jgi:hypothetical protein